MGFFVAIVSAMAFLAGAEVHGHGHILDPIARTSIHLAQPAYPYEPPYNYNPQSMWCDNLEQDLAVSNCGRCGDGPRGTDANQGGIYDKGWIVRNYTSGSIIDVKVEFGASHNGFFQFELCPQQVETDNCFQGFLPIVGGTGQIRDGNRMCSPNSGMYTARVQLPIGTRCARCTLRWTYRTSYGGWPDWDSCYNPHPAQVFRNCADIGII